MPLELHLQHQGPHIMPHSTIVGSRLKKLCGKDLSKTKTFTSESQGSFLKLVDCKEMEDGWDNTSKLEADTRKKC